MEDGKTIPASVVQEIRDQCLCFAAQKAARQLARRFDRVFAPLGITNGQFSMMVALLGMKSPRLGALADFLAMDQTTLTAAIKALEARGLVSRQADPDDQRARRVVLTETGSAVIAQAVPIWRQEIAAVRLGYGPERAKELLDLLRLLGVPASLAA